MSFSTAYMCFDFFWYVLWADCLNLVSRGNYISPILFISFIHSSRKKYGTTMLDIQRTEACIFKSEYYSI